MKKLLSLVIITWGVMIISVGCRKDPVVTPDPVPPPTPTPVSIKLTAHAANYGAVYYNGTDTVDIVSNGSNFTTTGGKVVGNQVIISNLTKDSTITVTGTLGTQNGSNSITIKVWDIRSSLYGNGRACKNDSARSCTVADTALPVNQRHWIPWNTLDCNTYYNYPNDSTFVVVGPSCSTNPNTSYSGTWIWKNNQTAIGFGGTPTFDGDVWNIPILNTTGWMRSQVKNGFYTEVYYSYR